MRQTSVWESNDALLMLTVTSAVLQRNLHWRMIFHIISLDIEAIFFFASK